MWFAALGTYQYNPWLIHTIHKILRGCTPVLDLLEEPSLATGDEKISSIRSVLYKYDFTRIDSSEWNQIVFEGVNEINISDWWTRSPVSEYLPPLEVDNPSVAAFLSSQGFQLNACFTSEQKCDILSETNPTLEKACKVLEAMRRALTKKKM